MSIVYIALRLSTTTSPPQSAVNQSPLPSPPLPSPPNPSPPLTFLNTIDKIFAPVDDDRPCFIFEFDLLPPLPC